MGRYDKIKVYNGTEFVQPSRIRIFDGAAWQDLGANDSDIQTPLNVHNGTDFVRATLNKTQVTVPGESYAAGDGFTVLPEAGFCFCPNSGNLTNATWHFEATMRKTSDSALNIFNVSITSGSYKGGYIKAVWNANGTVTVSGMLKSGSTVYSVTTSNAVKKDNWVKFIVDCAKGSSNVNVTLGSTKVTKAFSFNFQSSYVTNTVGATGMHFKETLKMQGTKYSNSTTTKTINMTTASGTTSDYKSVEHVNTTKTETQWL